MDFTKGVGSKFLWGGEDNNERCLKWSGGGRALKESLQKHPEIGDG